MIDESLSDRIAKIYQLVKHGTPGEQKAAKNLLGKILKKHNLDATILENIGKKEYSWKYVSELEVSLLEIIINNFSIVEISHCRRSTWKKIITGNFEYADYIVVECMYEYFRRHMKIQWKKISAVELKKCRKSKTRNKRRAELQQLFFTDYGIKSNLFKPEQLRSVEVSDQKELADRFKLKDVEGGQYSTQLPTNHLLEN